MTAAVSPAYRADTASLRYSDCPVGRVEAYAEAQRRGYEIVHPLTREPWGVLRFLVRAPDGNVVNIVGHRDE